MEEGKPLKLRRGFAALNAERRREIASQGGRAVQTQGTGHSWNFAEAQAAGQKGGQAFSLKRLFLKHITKEVTVTMTAFFVPLLLAPDQSSHFLTAASVSKSSRIKAAVLLVNKD